MLTKFLLACCGASQSKTLLGRVRITVGEGSGYRGYQRSVLGNFGSCQVLEGNIQTSNSSGSNYFYGLYSALNVTTNAMTTLALSDGPSITYFVENETNGVTSAGVVTSGASFDVEIFDGIATGQDCIIAIYYF